ILNEINFFSDALCFHTSMVVLLPKRTLSEMKNKRAPEYRTLPLELTYEGGPGKHNWAYWDKMIQRVLVWMFPVRKMAKQVPQR
ncbi:MAG TPA: hypothetical protein VJ830_01380, partial [Anaerolineales bacterium]|nr:hypothetical protein [Anaerolineales bacterium]